MNSRISRRIGLPAARRLTVVPLIAATFCMVAGGPYGLEEVVSRCGYRGAVILLVALPVLWALPMALLTAELASAIPEEGGYYVWVERGLGRFWGFQEAWLALTASIFDMALYPTLVSLYLGRLGVAPALAGGNGVILIGIAVIVASAGWNLLGARPVGEGSFGSTILLLAPFAAIVAIAVFRPGPPVPAVPVRSSNLFGGLLVAMWNFMGWDYSSTIAGEVDRPERAYPRAMGGALVLVSITYLFPVLAAVRAGIDPSGWSTGSWAEVGRRLGGNGLAIAVVAGGVVSSFAIFNALVLSHTRVPFALAERGLLPRIFARRSRRGAPTVSILTCAAAWALCLTLGFDRLVDLDVLLYGGSIVLEFVALVALRLREPGLRRPFRVPGGTMGAVAIGVFPALLLGVSIARNASERVAGVPLLAVGSLIASAGSLVYWHARRSRPRQAD